MKKSFKFGKSGIVVSAIAGFLVACGVMVYAATSNTFDSRKTANLPKVEGTNIAKLEADNWDDLMDTLNGLDPVPNGIIAPFFVSCPDGWTTYSTAQVPGTLSEKTWCIKGEYNPAGCTSNACGTTANGETCVSYGTEHADPCSNAQRTSRCYDGIWDITPFQYGSCSNTYGGGSSGPQCPTSNGGCPSGYSHTTQNRGTFIQNACVKNGNELCSWGSCLQNYCYFSAGACHYTDNGEPCQQ